MLAAKAIDLQSISIMREIKSVFYYSMYLAIIVVIYFYHKRTNSFYGQNYIALLGLLGIYFILYNGWNHFQWLVYTTISILLYIIDEQNALIRKTRVLWTILVIICLEYLFLTNSELYQQQLRHTRAIITMLLTIAVAKFMFIMPIPLLQANKGIEQHTVQERRKWVIFFVVLIIANINRLYSNLEDVITVYVGLLWAYAPSLSKEQQSIVQGIHKKERKFFQQNSSLQVIIKQNEANINEKEQTIAELTVKYRQLLQSQEATNKKVRQLTGMIQQKEGLIKEKQIKLKNQEQRIKSLLENDQAMQEEIQQLKNCLDCSIQDRSDNESVQYLME